MTSVLLIYPFFKAPRDRSVFRFPPLGIAYIASSLLKAGHQVQLLDCTFLRKKEALFRAKSSKAEVVGVYCMASMLDNALWFARELRSSSRFLIAGGPLPTCEPELFLQAFDIVVQGEGEKTITELIQAVNQGADLNSIAGIAFKVTSDGSPKEKIVFTPNRPFIRDLDQIPSPARDLLPNADYIRYGRKKYGYSITTIMTTRGCPFRCEFCSNVVFGGTFRSRSAVNVVDEIAEVLALGYDRISFADDVFTMRKERVIQICQEILRRGLQFNWECLGRVDALDHETALVMREAGCTRIFFGIESGDDEILAQMNKKITSDEARQAVEVAHRAGLQVGGFFIIGYPGDTNETVLKTLHFATALSLDYLGLSMPYPLPGTNLYRRTKDRMRREWRLDESPSGSHVLIFDADFSEAKMWFGIIKGHVQFWIKKKMGKIGSFVLPPFEKTTDWIFKLLK